MQSHTELIKENQERKLISGMGNTFEFGKTTYRGYQGLFL